METKHFLISKEENDYKTKEISVEKVNDLIQSGYRKLSDENISVLYQPENIKMTVKQIEVDDAIESKSKDREIIKKILEKSVPSYNYIFKLGNDIPTKTMIKDVDSGIYLVFCKTDQIKNYFGPEINNLEFTIDDISVTLCDYYPKDLKGKANGSMDDIMDIKKENNEIKIYLRKNQWNDFIEKYNISELFIRFIKLDKPTKFIKNNFDENYLGLINLKGKTSLEINAQDKFNSNPHILNNITETVSDKSRTTNFYENDNCVEFTVKQNQLIHLVARNLPKLPRGVCSLEIINPKNEENLYIQNNGNPIRVIRKIGRRVDQYFEAVDGIGISKSLVVPKAMIKKAVH